MPLQGRRPPLEGAELIAGATSRAQRRAERRAESAEDRGELDRWLLLLTVLLVGVGLVMVFSASQAGALLQHGSPLYYFERQAVWVALGLAALFFFARTDYRRLRRLAAPVAAVVALMMLLVLVPHIGLKIGGARRWFNLGPLGTVEPSELGKLAFAFFFADWLVRREERLLSVKEGLVPFCVLGGGVLALVMLEKDLGTGLVLAAIFASSFFAAGGRKRHLVLLVAGLAGAGVVVVLKESYRSARLGAFLHPFADPLGSGWQSAQSLYALGTGGITGVGLGHSMEKFLWLPEAQTDFIFAIIGEETGIIGTTLILAGFIAFAIRGYRIAMRAPDRYGAILSASLTTWIAFQALLNMATVTDTLPITGVPLPFISYGGTALATTLAAVGVLLNISRQSTARPRRDDSWRNDATADLGRGDRWASVPGPGGRPGLPR
ncbi:MAG: putative lipid II flippase FtsW [Candidatus Dormibacteraceae bacterium]